MSKSKITSKAPKILNRKHENTYYKPFYRILKSPSTPDNNNNSKLKSKTMVRLRSTKNKVQSKLQKNWFIYIGIFVILKLFVAHKHGHTIGLNSIVPKVPNLSFDSSILENLKQKWQNFQIGRFLPRFLQRRHYRRRQKFGYAKSQAKDAKEVADNLKLELTSQKNPTTSVGQNLEQESQSPDEFVHQTPQEPPPLPDNTCNRLLHTGKWDNWSYNPAPDGNLANTETGEWNYSGNYQPDGCDLHHYTTEEIETCLLKRPDGTNSDLSVMIIGDSRARLLYRVLSARLHGQDSIEDVKVHDDMANAPFIYYWSQSFHGARVARNKQEMSTFRRMLMEVNSKNKAQLIIINEHFLHPSTDILGFPKNRTWAHIEPYFITSLTHLKENIMPQLVTLSEMEDVTIIINASEGSSRYYAGWSADKWVELQNMYNFEIQRLIIDNPRIFYMTNNIRTGVGPSGQNLLPDGTHKIIKGESQTVPPSLMADTDMILNVHCNRKLGIDGNACCKQWPF